MATENQMLKGLAGLLGEDNESKFARERSFGKKLLITAWAVEIMAALLGLLIAFFMAYDAYNLTTDKGTSVILNSILGALPFLLIAIIEPTKIPLAGGLYKVKNWGWKSLILAALLGLTFVTFETMFTGLERQVENLTSIISRGENRVTNLEEDKIKLDKKLQEIEALSISDQTQDIIEQIEESRKQETEDLQGLKSAYEDNKDNLQVQFAKDEAEKNAIISEERLKRDEEISALSNKLSNKKEQITTLRIERDRLQNQLSGLRKPQIKDPQIEEYENQINEIENKINETNRFLLSGENTQIKRAQVTIGVVDDGKVGENTNRVFQNWKDSKEQNIASLSSQKTQRLKQISDDAKDTESEVLNRINSLEEQIKAEETSLNKISDQLTDAQITEDKFSINSPSMSNLDNSLTDIKDKLQALDDRFGVDQRRIKDDRGEERKKLDSKVEDIRTSVTVEKNKLNSLVVERDDISDVIVEEKQELRILAQKNQIYRFAQKYYEHEDILEVSEKELTRVSAVWYGSIALICATIGSILALISYIMSDPEAFVEKQRKKSKQPFRRAIRGLGVALRKKLLIRPKRIEVPVEVEKIIEVEKIVEVEKTVEVEKIKEVIKEVPVEKVEIKEVPVEIVRRELVHVPFYATEGGMVDVSEHLRETAPNSEKLKQGPKTSNSVGKKND